MLLPDLGHKGVFDILYGFLLSFIEGEFLVHNLIYFELQVKSDAVYLCLIFDLALGIVGVEDVLFEHLHQSALQQLVHCWPAIDIDLNALSDKFFKLTSEVLPLRLAEVEDGLMWFIAHKRLLGNEDVFL